MSLGTRIINLRKQKNLKQGELAQLLGIGQRHMIRLENDQSRPRPQTLESLATALGVSVEELLAEPSPQSLERIADPELKELLAFIPEFSQQKLDALKVLLSDMVTSHQVTRATSRHFNRALGSA